MKAHVLLTKHGDGTVTAVSVAVKSQNMQRLIGVTPLLRCVGIVGAVVREIEIEDDHLRSPYPPRRRPDSENGENQLD